MPIPVSLTGWSPALIVVALLAGPTLLWLLFRAMSNHERARAQPDYWLNTEPTIVTEQVDELISVGQLWHCVECRSLNRGRADRCYQCGTTRPIPPDPGATPILDEPVGPTEALVPTMRAVPADAAPGGRRGSRLADREPALGGSLKAAAVMGLAAPGQIRSGPGTVKAIPGPARSGRSPVSRGVPVMVELKVATEPEGRPQREVAPSSSRPRRTVRRTPAATGGRSSIGPLVGSCPLLGLRLDSRTRFEVPHTDHHCFATSPSSPIEPGHQEQYCLTADFRRCERYLVLDEIVAGREPLPVGPVVGRAERPAERPV